MRLLVTGATGFLGTAITRMALRRGHVVTRVGRQFGTGAGNLTDVGEVTRLLEDEAGTDLCIHAVGIADVVKCQKFPALAFESNLVTAYVLSQACQRRGIPFVLPSTDYIFDGSEDVYQEESIAHPLQTYGVTKYLGETVAATVEKHLIVRLPLLYDFGEHSHGFVSGYLAELTESGHVAADNVLRRFPTHVDDAATAILDLAQAGVTGKVHVSARNELSKYELMHHLGPVLQIPRNCLAELDADLLGQPIRPRRVKLISRRFDGLGIKRPREVYDVVREMGHTLP